MAVVAAPLSLLAPDSRADAESCARAYEQAQVHRQRTKLLEARRELVTCAQDRCPAVLRKDCVAWLSQVEQELPAITVRVRGQDGCDRTDARVFLDDVEIASRSQGLPVEVDPGPHAVRAELDGKVVSQTVVVAVGERRRQVTVGFAPPGTTCGARDPGPRPAARPAAATSVPATPPERPRTPALVYVLGGAGLAALGVGAGFGISAWDQKGSLDACRGACAASDVDAMQRTFLVADIGLGVGLASLSAAALVYFLRAR